MYYERKQPLKQAFTHGHEKDMADSYTIGSDTIANGTK